jgi:hypothetical protein
MVFGEKLATLSELLRPVDIVLDNHQLYITDDMSVFIYSLQDFRLKKKFGRAGEGPREFKNFVHVIPWAEQLIVNSGGKVSFFTKDGVFIKELKTGIGLGSALYLPLKKSFVAIGRILENQMLYTTINLYDSNLTKIKELCRIKTRQRSGKLKLLKQTFKYKTYENKIYIAAKQGFVIDVLDHNGKFRFSIRQDYKQQPFTSEDEKKIRRFFKKTSRDWYESQKHLLEFPEYYPDIRDFVIEDNRIYVYTHRVENQGVEFFIFDLKGKLLKKRLVPIALETTMQSYPFYIKHGKLFQVIENEEEEWELHSSVIYKLRNKI